MTPIVIKTLLGTLLVLHIYLFLSIWHDDNTSYSLGLRPVINLKSTLKLTDDGTKNNPFIPNL